MGTFHRLGLVREQLRSVDNLETEEINLGEELSPGELEVTTSGVSSTVGAGDGRNSNPFSQINSPQALLSALDEYVSLQGRAHSMFFGSSNILNTEEDPIQGAQYAQFLGATADVEFRGWKLGTSYDYAWFRYLEGSLSEGDFNTSTIRQALSYDLPFLGDRASYTFEPSWQYSSLVSRQSGDQTFAQWMYSLSNEFSFFPFTWMIPTFSYNFFYQNANIPDAVADKWKNDFNLGVTFIPIEDFRLYISPSVQYSIDGNIGINRVDSSWTPTMAVSVQPLDFLAVDFVGSYTDSRSTLAGSSYTAFSGTILIRAFYRF